jgi:hypothetical protein
MSEQERIARLIHSAYNQFLDENPKYLVPGDDGKPLPHTMWPELGEFHREAFLACASAIIADRGASK